jgi:cytochrome c oxidase subunit 2
VKIGRRKLTVSGLTGAALASSACSGGMLDPRSPSAESIADLWWIMFGISLAVFLLVLGILAIGLVRASRRTEVAHTSGAAEWTWVVAGGIALPIVVLMALMVLSILTSRSIVQAQSEDALAIEVNGRQWWWEVRYSEQGFVTANPRSASSSRSPKPHSTAH